MLNAGDAQNHIRHSLGNDMSSEVSHMDVVNLAGRYLCSMHPWKWLARRETTVDLEAGIGFVRLPKDLGALHQVRGGSSAARDVCFNGMGYLHERRLDGEDTYPWTGAITRRVMPVRNLLRYSAGFSQSGAWSYSNGTGAVTDNATINPFTGASTGATVSDSDATAVSALTQTIPAHLLKDNTAYSVGVTLAPSPITTTTPPKSGILVSTPSPDSGGLQTLVEVQWGSTPWQDAPTATVIGTNTGGATAGTPIPVGQGCWTIPILGYTHQLDENYGTMRVSVQPARAAWSDDSGTTDITQTGTIALLRAQVNEGKLLTDYEATGATIVVPRRAEPVLEISPTPSATEANALSILYSAFWVDAEDDGDDLALPSEGWLDTLYLQILRAFARGWEEEDSGSLDERLSLIERGPIAMRAKQHDGLIQRRYGQMKNTAWDASKRRPGGLDFETSFASAGPTSA